MRELTTLETFPITGRGTAHTVHVGDEPPKLDDRVLLDGEVLPGDRGWVADNTGDNVDHRRPAYSWRV